VDFTGRDLWRYSFTVEVGGEAELPDSAHSFTDTLRCRLTGTSSAEAPHSLAVRATDVSLKSALLDDIETLCMQMRLQETALSISLNEGFVAVDSGIGAAVPLGTWDLYRHFVKVLPVLPAAKARPGFQWDRQTTLPLHTDHGDATAQLYQSFSFDSLTRRARGANHAYLSWDFSYTVDPVLVDTAGLLDDLPRKGTGKGQAVIDVVSKALIRAEAKFTVAPNPADPARVAWHERAEMVLVN
jgi:hypothetical protein